MRTHLAKLALVWLLLAAVPSPVLAQTPCPTTFACATSKKYLSAASNNSTSVTAVNTALFNIITVNTTTTLYYLKLYDKATAPTCGTDVPVAVYPVPFGTSNAGGGFQMTRSVPVGFTLGLGFCLVAGIADNDNNAAATGVAINMEYR